MAQRGRMERREEEGRRGLRSAEAALGPGAGRDVAAGQKPGDRRRVMATWRETPFSAASAGLRPRRRAGRRRRLGRFGILAQETAIGVLLGLAPGLGPFRGRRHAEQASRSREPTALHAVGEQPVVAHAHEASRDDMVQEATAELDPGNGLGLPPTTIPSVLVGEGDLAVAIFDVFVCRRSRVPLRELWPQLKQYD